jgi:hypothetical protein
MKWHVSNALQQKAQFRLRCEVSTAMVIRIPYYGMQSLEALSYPASLEIYAHVPPKRRNHNCSIITLQVSAVLLYWQQMGRQTTANWMLASFPHFSNFPWFPRYLKIRSFSSSFQALTAV